MKLFFRVAILSLSCFTAILPAAAQISASGKGTVGTNQTVIKKNLPDLSKFDFKNYTYPDFISAQPAKTFTLKDGATVKKAGVSTYTLRKTYFFDLTGDGKDEAITHILADGCQLGCESSSMFFVHTADDKQPKLLWKIAVGGDTFGGLKAINFKLNEIVVETFGECAIKNDLINSNIDLKQNPKLKTTNYTRFVFTRNLTGYVQTARDLLPLAGDFNIAEYRSQINFGQ